MKRDRSRRTFVLPRSAERLIWACLVFFLFSANQSLRTKELLSSHEDESSDPYQMALEESFGFFNDLPEDLWMERKRITHQRTHVGLPHPLRTRIDPPAWYQQNWDPDFVCLHEDEIGGNQDGHKWVCDPHRLKEYDDCLIYSFGSNNDFRFERDLQLTAPNCEVHIFDPTDYSRSLASDPRWKSLNATYHAWGIQSSYETFPNETEPHIYRATKAQLNRKHRNPLVFHTLAESMELLGHTGRRVDVFKIDCEGCEWKSYHDFLKADLRQVLIEVHEVVHVTYNFFEDLHQAGYVMFHKEPNIQFGGGRCVEFGFLKLAPQFFQ